MTDHDSLQHERRFHGEADRLRAPDRIARLEVERVVTLSLESLTVQRLLDIGTGSGVFAEAFARLVPSVTGLDTNSELLAVARGYVPGAEFREAPAEDLPFEAGSFDLAFLGHVLHETDDPLKALQEARRVARSRVVVLEWPYQDEPHGPPLEHRLKPQAIEDYASHAGFSNTERIELTQMDFYRLTP
jgi:ubiquinone/menaquinone biosynthesis C-methylase UbiE